MLSHTLRRVGNNTGTLYWAVETTGTNITACRSVCLDADDDIYISGSYSGDDGAIEKISGSGTHALGRYYNTTDSTSLYQVQPHSSGDLIASGNWRSTYFSGHNVRITSEGVADWNRETREAAGTTAHHFRANTLDSSDNIIAVGYTTDTSYGGSTDGYIVKLSDTGTLSFKLNVGDANSNLIHSAAVDGSDNIYMGIYATGSAYFHKLTSAGAASTSTKFTGSGQLDIPNMVRDGSAIYIAVHDNATPGTTHLVKMTTGGAVTWQRKINAALTNYEPQGLAVDSSGNVYALLLRDLYSGSPTKDMELVKYNSSGTQQWGRRIEWDSLASRLTHGKNLAIDSNDNLIVVTGVSTNSATVIYKLPSDGSLTGTHGNLVYSSVTVPDAAGTLTVNTSDTTINSTTHTAHVATSLSTSPTSYTVSTELTQPII